MQKIYVANDGIKKVTIKFIELPATHKVNSLKHSVCNVIALHYRDKGRKLNWNKKNQTNLNQIPHWIENIEPSIQFNFERNAFTWFFLFVFSFIYK